MSTSESKSPQAGPTETPVVKPPLPDEAPGSPQHGLSDRVEELTRAALEKNDAVKIEARPSAKSSHDPELNSVVQALGVLADAITLKLREPALQTTRWERMRKGFVLFAKDVGSFVTGLAGIAVSVVVGLLTVTVTASVAFFNYQFNARQAEVNSRQAQATQMSLKTAALTDFIEEDEGKRTLAAIKLAAYGDEALPAIELALGVTHERIRRGGVQTAEVMYQSRPDLQKTLLADMLKSFQASNPTLRLGVLEFYLKAAPQLTLEEKQTFLNQLKLRLGTNAKSCANENGTFVMQSAAFLTKGPFQEAKELLLDIARNCPHEPGNLDYEGARNQALTMLVIVVKQLHLPKDERDAIISTLSNLKADASIEFNGNLDTTIKNIGEIRDP